MKRKSHEGVGFGVLDAGEKRILLKEFSEDEESRFLREESRVLSKVIFDCQERLLYGVAHVFYRGRYK